MNPRPAVDLRFSRILAGNMRRLREKRGLSASALADMVKADGHRMSEQSINQFEHCRTRTPRAMTVDHLMWLAKALDAPLTSLLSEQEDS